MNSSEYTELSRPEIFTVHPQRNSMIIDKITPEVIEKWARYEADFKRLADQLREADMRTAAYFLWEKAGKPVNRDLEFWAAAERAYRQKQRFY